MGNITARCHVRNRDLRSHMRIQVAGPHLVLSVKVGAGCSRFENGTYFSVFFVVVVPHNDIAEWTMDQSLSVRMSHNSVHSCHMLHLRHSDSSCDGAAEVITACHYKRHNRVQERTADLLGHLTRFQIVP